MFLQEEKTAMTIARSAAGSPMPLLRFSDERRTKKIHAYATSIGVVVADPHTYHLGLGNKKALTPQFFEAKRQFDPHGLMNPGKLQVQPEETLS